MGFFGNILNRKKNVTELRNLRKQLEEEFTIVAGIPSDATPYPDGTSVALVGAWNEFGTSRIPERSFMRSTINENEDRYTKLAERLIADVADGKSTLFRAANIIGMKMSDDIKQKITELDTPPNAPSTIKRKGSDNPLIDTGHMRASVNYEVRERDENA